MVSIESLRQSSIMGFTEYSGIELTDAGEGYTEGLIRITEHHLNPLGTIHGGVTFCLADVMGGIALKTLNFTPTTVNSNISYIRPLIHDKVIYCRADVIKQGINTAYVEIKVYNEQHEEAVRVIATYFNVSDRIRGHK